jgi:pyridoxal phosphate enzyme (YggS family)
MTQVRENLNAISTKICKAACECNRAPETVRLMAVSKTQSVEKIQEALASGHRCFGENRVQEAESHWAELRNAYPGLALHLIGPLQTNKVREAVALFDVIETVDREHLADVLAAEMDRQNRFLSCYIQVNTGKEPQKAGVFPEELEKLLRYCRSKDLNISGLMCIPPVGEPSALHFALLQKLARRYGLSELSMGMSSDFEKAIPLGATIVRVGTALFGER